MAPYRSFRFTSLPVVALLALPGLVLAQPATTATLAHLGATTSSAAPVRLSPAEEDLRLQRLQAAALADDWSETTSLPPVLYRDLETTVGLVTFPPGRPPADPGAYRVVSTTETLTGPMGRQPQGALTGKIVFASAGHGWTNDNTSTSLWYTQRPALFGLVEDFGNLDQMNLYAEMVYRAGATVVPLRPLGFQRVERLVDNDSPHHTTWQGPWLDSQSTVAFTLWQEKVPYRFTYADLDETALVRFRPVIPRADYYPVYTWARTGADRVNQTYRVVHSGGATEVQIDHRLVGNGWIYLGEFYFEKGTDGYVEITNKVENPAFTDGAHVVVADAIRFGNGLGDINRGGGISGRPREEEASRYWVQSQLSKGVEPVYEAFEGKDQNTNVGTPPRMAAHMNRETAGSFFDRVFLSFHSNAVGGRGVLGLYCAEPEKRPDCQVEWAELVAREINAEMLSGRSRLEVPWSVHPKLTQAHINFGEIRRDYLNNEMTATIAEVAYHDNPLDALLLRMPSIRMALARAAYSATLKYFHNHTPRQTPVVYLPPAPEILAVTTDETSAVVVRWAPSPEGEKTSAPIEAYRVYHSTNGYGFDGGLVVSGTTTRRYEGLTTGIPHFFRVTAVNSGGESRPSRTLGTFALGQEAKLLLVSGFSSLSDDLVLTQTAPANMNFPLGPPGEFVRIIPGFLNPGTQVASAGVAAAQNRRAFDSTTLEGLTSGAVDLGRYAAVALMFGRQEAAGQLLREDLMTSISEFAAGGGGVFVSGASYARALDEATTRPSPAARRFALQTLGLRHGGQTSGVLAAVGEPDSLLSTATLLLHNPLLPEMLPRANDIVTPGEGARPLLRYDNPEESVAALRTRKAAGGQGEIVAFGFPFEEIQTAEARREVMALVLGTLGLPEETLVSRERVSPLGEKKHRKPPRERRGGRHRSRRR